MAEQAPQAAAQGTDELIVDVGEPNSVAVSIERAGQAIQQQVFSVFSFVFDDDDRRGMAVDSMVSGGCVISGARVSRSLLFSNVKVHSFAEIEDSVVLPDVDVGRHCRISKAVVDSIQLSLGLPPSIYEDPDESGFYIVGHASQVLAFSPDGSIRVIYPFGTRQSDWMHDIPKLAAAAD